MISEAKPASYISTCNKSGPVETLLNQLRRTLEARGGSLTPLKITDLFICVSATDRRLINVRVHLAVMVSANAIINMDRGCMSCMRALLWKEMSHWTHAGWRDLWSVAFALLYRECNQNITKRERERALEAEVHDDFSWFVLWPWLMEKNTLSAIWWSRKLFSMRMLITGGWQWKYQRIPNYWNVAGCFEW